MPFNRVMASITGRRFILAALNSEDLELNYDVESQIASQFPGQTPTRKGDQILLTLGAVDLIAASSLGYAIDADSVHDEAIFTITMTTGGLLAGRGGKGGSGGFADAQINPPIEDLSGPGQPGKVGGTAIRYGCITNVIGTGEIRKGYGGGGGGGGYGQTFPLGGGGGGGGGAALGDGGAGGIAKPPFDGVDGNAGTVATVANNGTGGTGGNANAGDGGDGGDTGSVSQAGTAGSKAGGAAGVDGNAIDSQGLTHTEGGGITVTGDII